MKRGTIAIGLGAAAIAAWYWMRAPARASDEPADEPRAAPLATSDRAVHPLQHVTTLASSDERRRVAEQIERAHAARAGAALHAPRPPSLPIVPQLRTDDIDAFKTTFRAAMREVIPILAECYTHARAQLPDGELIVKAKLSLDGDPDIGTLIDAHAIESEQAIPTELDACLRDTFQRLELPPLAEGDHVDVTYPLVFRDD